MDSRPFPRGWSGRPRRTTKTTYVLSKRRRREAPDLSTLKAQVSSLNVQDDHATGNRAIPLEDSALGVETLVPAVLYLCPCSSWTNSPRPSFPPDPPPACAAAPACPRRRP